MDLSSMSTSIWTASWQGLAFAIGVWAVTFAFKRLPSSVKAWLWWLAAAKLLLGLVWAGVSIPLLPSQPDSPLAKLNQRLDLMAPRIPGKIIVGPLASPTPAERRPAIPLSESEWIAAGILLAWFAGALTISIGIARQGSKLRRLRKESVAADAGLSGEIAREIGAKMGLSRRPRVFASSEITAPMVAGLFSPALYLPAKLEATLDDRELRLCIAHELAHIRRHDLVFAIVPTLMQVCFYFYPPAWLIRREWELEREAACDAEAIAVNSASPSSYGKLLIKIVTADHRGAFTPALGATANYHTLKKRITNMKHLVPMSRRLRLAGTTIAVLGLMLAIPWQMTSRAQAASPAPVDDKNVVVNGGFEQGMDSWFKSALLGDDPPVTIAVDSTTHHSGSSSLRFDRTNPSFVPVAVMSQVLPYQGEGGISVSLWAKAQDVHKFTLAVIMQGAEGKIEWGAYIGDPNTGSEAINHDWKRYTKSINIPKGTTNVILALEMYGPGSVWVDDVSATFGAAGAAPPEDEDATSDVKDVSNEDLKIGNDPMMRYFLIGAKGPEPAEGYKLILVLPGGDGSANFNAFVRRIWKFAMPKGYVIAELVAPKWSDDQFQKVVWPTRKLRWQGMKFATEDFVEAVIKDVSRKHKIDAGHVMTLSWSSGGTAAYACSLNLTSIKGSFIAMSSFHPSELPSLLGAKGQAYYLYQSPDDTLTRLSEAQLASTELSKAGGKTTLVTYEGGHGWRGDVYGSIQKGITWLEENTK